MRPPAIGLGELLERQAARFGDRPFLSFGDGQTFSFAETASHVAKMRGLLGERGVRQGDRVAMMLKNSLFFPVAWLGAVSAGAVAVPVNSRLGPEDGGFIVRHSGASMVTCDEETGQVARAAAKASGRDLEVLEMPAGEHLPRVIADATRRDAVAATDRSLANVQYTSGTTGFPKGCLLTHGYWQWMGAAAAELLGLGPEKRILTAQPFSYIDPQWNVVAALQSGAHLVILDGFHPSTFMQDVVRWRVTAFYCLGVMPTLLLKQPPSAGDRDHSLEHVACSAIPPELHRTMEERWGVPWFEVFGMTETGINIAVLPHERDRLVGSGSMGRALDHCEAAVVDEEGRDVPRGELGELRLRGLGFMEGYLDDPEATAAFFRDGWANTGDVVRMNEEGLIFLQGRKKEMIRRGGENIAQAEVEFALRAHPDVLDCAVTSVPDETLGEEGKAYVVMRDGSASDPEALREFLAAKLARFKIPRYYEFREDLPRTPSERIAKGQLEQGRPSWHAQTYDTIAGAWLNDENVGGG
ncbi:MAG: AMP-binding protein [Actinomycetota bacterium]|nr:AMP-binding protein [Actinomycetota bacterium]